MPNNFFAELLEILETTESMISKTYFDIANKTCYKLSLNCYL